MSVVTFPVGLLVDDAGAILSAPVVTILSVTDKAGTPIGTPGATVNGSGTATPISVDYDPETKGEAWITLSVSQSAHTVTGPNAEIVIYAARDSGRIDTNVGSRLATSGYTPPLDAAGTHNALGLASANLDTQLALIEGHAAAADTASGLLPSAAAILAAFKADGEWKTMLANVNGVFTFDPVTEILVLKDKAGAVTLATLTLTKDGAGNITARASS
jgi:hypothetical protein